MEFSSATKTNMKFCSSSKFCTGGSRYKRVPYDLQTVPENTETYGQCHVLQAKFFSWGNPRAILQTIVFLGANLGTKQYQMCKTRTTETMARKMLVNFFVDDKWQIISLNERENYGQFYVNTGKYSWIQTSTGKYTGRITNYGQIYNLWQKIISAQGFQKKTEPIFGFVCLGARPMKDPIPSQPKIHEFLESFAEWLKMAKKLHQELQNHAYFSKNTPFWLGCYFVRIQVPRRPFVLRGSGPFLINFGNKLIFFKKFDRFGPRFRSHLGRNREIFSYSLTQTHTYTENPFQRSPFFWHK